MQYIPLGANAYSADTYGLPALKLENWYAEAAGDRVDRPYRLIPAPGLSSFATSMNGAIRGLFQADGLLSGDIIAAAGLRVYRVNSSGTPTEVGTITGTGGVSFAGSQLDCVMTAGGTAYKVDTGSIASITVGASTGDIVDCAEIAQRHVFLEDGTGRFWWSGPADATTVENTSFATAETEPDNLLALHVYGDTVFLFGTQSTEGWVSTGDTVTPFVRRPGFAVNKGIMGRDAVASADFGLFVVADDGIVYRLDGMQPRRISTHTIERLLEDVATADRVNVRVSAHQWGGHTFVGVHMPGVGDYFYDVATQTWHRRREINATRYLPHIFVEKDGDVFAGDATAGNIYQVDRDVYTHNGNAVRRVATAIVPVEDARPVVANVTVELMTGAGLLTGQGSDPQVLLRYSRDGRTWSQELTRSFGKIGDYLTRAIFGMLGRFSPPVMLLEVAVSDPVPATVTGLAVDRVKS
jgi:hypothetical protein